MPHPTVSSLALTCPYCGTVHRPVELARGERAHCARCELPLLRGGPTHHAALALAWAAILIAIPAVRLPLVTVSKFGAEHASYLWSGVRAVWHQDMPLLAIWVALCGIVVPLALLTTLLMVIFESRSGHHSRGARFWRQVARAFQRWSMPEVQVLAVLVAFVKIGALVQVRPGAGLWCYGAMSALMLLAWRSAELRDAP